MASASAVIPFPPGEAKNYYADDLLIEIGKTYEHCPSESFQPARCLVVPGLGPVVAVSDRSFDGELIAKIGENSWVVFNYRNQQVLERTSNREELVVEWRDDVQMIGERNAVSAFPYTAQAILKIARYLNRSLPLFFFIPLSLIVLPMMVLSIVFHFQYRKNGKTHWNVLRIILAIPVLIYIILFLLSLSIYYLPYEKLLIAIGFVDEVVVLEKMRALGL